jgi:hypothetical protein
MVSVSFSACRCNSVVVSSKEERKKNLETVLWMAICCCGLTACCCQPALAGGFIYADLRYELNTDLALQALFTQSSPVSEPLLQAFPFPSSLGEVTLHQLSKACVFIYSSHGKWVFPPLLWSFPPTATFTSFPAPDRWVVLLLLPSPAGLLWGISPPPLFGAQGTAPSLPCIFLLLLFIIQLFFFFPWVGVDLSRGLCWSGPGLSARVPCPAYLTLWSVSSQAIWVLPSGGGMGALLVKWRCYAQARGVEESKFCLFLVVFPVRCISSISPRFYFRRHAFCFISLAAVLESKIWFFEMCLPSKFWKCCCFISVYYFFFVDLLFKTISFLWKWRKEMCVFNGE